MVPAAPQAGMVLHYNFLWKHEAERGQKEGARDRPVVVLVLMGDGEEVVVAPITTLAPEQGAPAIEVPARECGNADPGLWFHGAATTASTPHETRQRRFNTR